MTIETVNNYRSDENAYIVFDGGEAVVIDPGSGADVILNRADELGVSVKYALITHCHYDHIIGLKGLREKGAKLVSGRRASQNIQNPMINLSSFSLDYEIREKPSDIIMSDGEALTLCGMDIECVYTPGHTDCGVCYKIGNALFSGDTLFLRSVGRSDLPTGDAKALERSVRERLYTLDGGTEVYPGHGGKTSIGYEKRFNLFVTADGE